jgi:hypothetical protein
MQLLQGQNVVNSIDGWKSRPKFFIQNSALFRLHCLAGECKLRYKKYGACGDCVWKQMRHVVGKHFPHELPSPGLHYFVCSQKQIWEQRI